VFYNDLESHPRTFVGFHSITLFKTTKVQMGAVDSKIKCETNYDNTATATSEIYFT